MQILIKKIDEAEPTIVLNDVYMIYEGGDKSIDFYVMHTDVKPGGTLAEIINMEGVEYFRKVGD